MKGAHPDVHNPDPGGIPVVRGLQQGWPGNLTSFLLRTRICSR